MSIYYPYTVLVNGDKSTLTDDKGKKKDIYLYMGDKNIDYYFTVKEASFNFRKNEGTNIIEQTSPSHAAVSLLKPDGTYVCSNKQAISEDQIKFTITPEMIDEITEVGDHTIVISLLDEENDSIATIPPIEGQMHILERVTPLPGVDITTNLVNEAVVSLAHATTEDEVLNVFDDNGNYIKTVWSNGDRITQERLNKVEEGIFRNNSAIKNIADRTEILPIENTHYVIQNGVPASQQNINMNRFEFELYIFNDEQITVPDDSALENFDDKISAIKSQSRGLLNAVISYNDGTNDITKEVELIGNDYTSNFEYAEDSDTGSFVIEFGFNFDINKFYIYVGYMINGMDSPVFYAVKNATISYNCYSNLIRDEHISDIKYSKISEVPYRLNYLANGMTKTLSIKEYTNLFDNLFIWDANKINERLDGASGVKQNVYYDHTIQIKQKDSEGIGFGQYIPASTMAAYKLFVSAGPDVIIKVYQHETKKFLGGMKDFSIGEYKELEIMDRLNNSDGIFIAFTVKDTVTSFNARTYVSDLVLCKSEGFLTKQEVNNKVDKSQLSFNSNGELVVTIDGISKTFVPKTE